MSDAAHKLDISAVTVRIRYRYHIPDQVLIRIIGRVNLRDACTSDSGFLQRVSNSCRDAFSTCAVSRVQNLKVLRVTHDSTLSLGAGFGLRGFYRALRHTVGRSEQNACHQRNHNQYEYILTDTGRLLLFLIPCSAKVLAGIYVVGRPPVLSRIRFLPERRHSSVILTDGLIRFI